MAPWGHLRFTVYGFIRFFVGLGLRQFFSRIDVRGAALVRHGPLLVVSNHPNLALDPLVVGLIYPRPLWFLGKSTLFTGVMGPLLRAAHVIPVYRRQDDPSQMDKNQGTFSVAAKILAEGAGVAIFPEGVSLGERRLIQIKTGAARIVIQALKDHHGDPIQIQAVGITYGDLQRFRARVTLVVHEPYSILPSAILNSEDPVRILTTMIEEALRRVTVDLPTPEQQDVAEQIARLYGSTARESDDFDRFRVIALHLAMLSDRDRERFRWLEDRLRCYITRVDALGLLDEAPLDLPVPWRQRGLSIVLGALGALFYYMPYRLIGVFAARASHPVEVASVKFFVGLVLFPLWVFVLTVLVFLIFGTLTAILFALAMGPLGFIANHRMPLVRRALLGLLGGVRSHALESLIRERDAIIRELDTIRDSMVPMASVAKRYEAQEAKKGAGLSHKY